MYGQTKGTELESIIAHMATAEAVGGTMYYALAKIAKEKFGLDKVAEKFIELGNQETNHGAFYAMLNGKYPSDEKGFWRMVKCLSKAEYNADNKLGQLVDKLAASGIDEDIITQVREFAIQEKHHGEVTKAIIDEYAPKEENKDQKVYICSVCGFEYEGELDNENDDYVCPICGCKKGVFKLK
ncbi:MAG: hypothetical protein K6A89_08425 [Treponema sp.]|nr:hypothetical protein [Treponema sp.]